MKPTRTESALFKRLERALYFLRFDDRTLTLSLFVRTAFAEKIDRHITNRPDHSTDFKACYQEYYPEKPRLFGICGFNECIEKTVFGEWTRLGMQLKKGETEEVLRTKKLTGGGSMLNETSRSLVSVAISLALLLRMLDYYEAITGKRIEEDFPDQPYALETFTEKKSKGFGIAGALNGIFIQALAKRHASLGHEARADALLEEKRASQSMRKAIRLLSPDTKGRSYALGVGLRKDSFLVQADMGAAGLGVWPQERDTYRFIETGGVAMSGHNIDTPFNQLVILIGFARLSEIVIRNG